MIAVGFWGRTKKEHFHDFVEMVFTLNGQDTQVIQNKEYSLSAGDLFLLLGNQKHFFRDAGQVEIINAMFDRS